MPASMSGGGDGDGSGRLIGSCPGELAASGDPPAEADAAAAGEVKLRVTACASACEQKAGVVVLVEAAPRLRKGVLQRLGRALCLGGEARHGAARSEAPGTETSRRAEEEVGRLHSVFPHARAGGRAVDCCVVIFSVRARCAAHGHVPGLMALVGAGPGEVVTGDGACEEAAATAGRVPGRWSAGLNGPTVTLALCPVQSPGPPACG